MLFGTGPNTGALMGMLSGRARLAYAARSDQCNQLERKYVGNQMLAASEDVLAGVRQRCTFG
jgi:hypothetical protein